MIGEGAGGDRSRRVIGGEQNVLENRHALRSPEAGEGKHRLERRRLGLGQSQEPRVGLIGSLKELVQCLPARPLGARVSGGMEQQAQLVVEVVGHFVMSETAWAPNTLSTALRNAAMALPD